MNKILLISLGMILIFAGLASAEPSYIFKQNTDVDLKIFCYDEDYIPCSSAAECNITILYPNNSVLKDGIIMSHNQNYYNLTLSVDDTSEIGEYSCTVVCANTLAGISTFNYLVTYTGEKFDTSDAITYFVGIMLLIIFIIICAFGITRVDNLWGKVAFSGLIYLSLIAISYIAFITSANIAGSSVFLSRIFRIMFIFLMYAALPLFVGIGIWSVWMMISIKELRGMIDRGVPEDEAYMRQFGKGYDKYRNWGKGIN